MDPNEALKNARAALRTIRRKHDEDEGGPAVDLADAFEALDGWLSKGNCLPRDWSPNETPYRGGPDDTR